MSIDTEGAGFADGPVPKFLAQGKDPTMSRKQVFDALHAGAGREGLPPDLVADYERSRRYWGRHAHTDSGHPQ